MLRIVLALAALLAAFVAVVLLMASRKPDTFQVERHIVITAEPAVIHAQISSFQRWQAWSPWEGKDPDLKRSYSGPAQGVGAAYAWEGNDDVGAGRMEIVSSDPASGVQIQLDFVRPFEAHNTARFSMQPDGAATRLTWSMQGPSPLLSKVMQVFFSMDEMVGADFEKGLQRLKAVAEQPAATASAPS